MRLLVLFMTIYVLQQADVVFDTAFLPKWFPAIILILVSLTSLIRLKATRRCFSPSGTICAWFAFFGPWIVFLILESFTPGKHPNLNLLMSDSSFWFLAIMVIHGHRVGDWYWLNRMLVLHAIIGCVFTAFSLRSIQPTIGMMPDRSEILTDYSSLGALSILEYSVPFLAFTYSRQSRLGRITVVIGLTLWLAAYVIGQFRHGVIVVGLTILLSLYNHYRTGNLRGILPVVRPTLIVVLICLAITHSAVVWKDGLLTKSYQALVIRFTTDDPAQANYGLQARIHEGTYALSELSPLEWWTGRGITGTWSGRGGWDCSYKEQRDMLHFGPMHFILKGGIPLLVLLLIFPFAAGIKQLCSSRDPLMLASASVVFLWLVECLYANYSCPSPNAVLRFICAGQCVRVALPYPLALLPRWHHRDRTHYGQST